ncbi:hypothetical protein [Campylobacter coli]|uniref:hypothetical protein n=1 Tax=Campylobacter coli TaxID=195 RepID=UPI000B017D3C|nr:hypothetical protein [Campylobacter coli]
MADLEQVVNDLNLASQSLQELREKYDGALDLLDNKNTEITGALDSAKSNALQEMQTISDTATSQISQLKDTSLNLVNEAKNTAITEISNKKEEYKQELETKKNEYISEIDAKANEYDIANINAQVQAMDTKITEQINGAKTELNSKIDNKVTKTGDETIAGVKTFSSSIVIPNATANNHATNLGQLNGKVAKTGDETIAGVKTFSVPPVSATNPTANNQVANKSYVDTVGNSKVSLNGNQTIAGTKTFSAVPACSVAPTANNHLANKSYVDNKVSSAGSAGAVVLKSSRTTTGDWTISGLKVGVPLYIINSLENSTGGYSRVRLFTKSGAIDGNGNSTAHFGIGYGADNISSNIFIVIPTTSSVVISIVHTNDNVTLRAYQ